MAVFERITASRTKNIQTSLNVSGIKAGTRLMVPERQWNLFCNGLRRKYISYKSMLLSVAERGLEIIKTSSLCVYKATSLRLGLSAFTVTEIGYKCRMEGLVTTISMASAKLGNHFSSLGWVFPC